MKEIYYGDGKGKTTAALGAAIREKGARKSVLFISFLKDNESSERKAETGIEFYENPKKVKFLFEMSEEEKEEYKKWVLGALEAARESAADMVVLDEFLDVAQLLNEEELRSIEFKEEKEYIITGHKKNEYLFGMADYITYMKKEKHPFDVGVKAREGIEF